MVGPVSTKTKKDKSAGKAKENVPELARRSTSYDPYADIMDLQSMTGNRVVSQLLQSDMNGVPPIIHIALRGESGQLLDPAVRVHMESRFGHDFGQVRVHTDAIAAEAAKALGARAYTVGQDIVFGQGQFFPTSSDGQKLLAHELTHTIQQKQANNRSLKWEMPNRVSNLAEIEAQKAATAVQQGEDVSTVASNGQGIQCDTSWSRFAPDPICSENSQPEEESPVKCAYYVDDFLEVGYYNPYYRAESGRWSTWLQVLYPDPSIPQIDINWDDIGDETTSTEIELIYGDEKTTRVVFPQRMNRSTTPRLWEYKQQYLRMVNDMNAIFILETSPIWMPTPPVGLGGTQAVTRRPMLRYMMPSQPAKGTQSTIHSTMKPRGLLSSLGSKTKARIVGAAFAGEVALGRPAAQPGSSSSTPTAQIASHSLQAPIRPVTPPPKAQLPVKPPPPTSSLASANKVAPTPLSPPPTRSEGVGGSSFTMPKEKPGVPPVVPEVVQTPTVKPPIAPNAKPEETLTATPSKTHDSSSATPAITPKAADIFSHYEVCEEDRLYIRNLLATVLNELSEKTRDTIRRYKTIAITLVQDVDDGHLHFVWTGNRHYGNREISSAMSRHGIERWNEATPEEEGRGDVGAPQDAEQLALDLIDEVEFKALLIVTSRPFCDDCRTRLMQEGVQMVDPPEW